MKNMLKKVISLVLVFAMVFTFSVPASAAGFTGSRDTGTLIEIKDDSGGVVRVDYETKANGDQVFTQYLNNVMTDRNVIKAVTPDIVYKTVYNETASSSALNASKAKETQLNIKDYISVQNNPSRAFSAYSGSTTLGTINYRTLVYEGTLRYGLRVSYTENTSGPTTYTIKSFAGKLVDLISIVVGAINLPKALTATFLKRLLVSAGITVAGGFLSNALSTTVACDKTTYNMKLVDTTYSGHTKTVYGYKYYVPDTDSYTGETYYEGYVPQDWGTQALGVWLHNEMFAYSTFDIVSWS